MYAFIFQFDCVRKKGIHYTNFKRLHYKCANMQNVSSNGFQFIVYIAVKAIDFNKFSLEAATYVLENPGF